MIIEPKRPKLEIIKEDIPFLLKLALCIGLGSLFILTISLITIELCKIIL